VSPIKNKKIVIIENGGANIASLRFALERLGCEAQLSGDPQTIRNATHVILPGVGAAADAMKRLRARNLDELIPTLEQPVLGICLGMQLLYEASEEGDARCLGAIPGTARKFNAAPDLPVPHMGWNQLRAERSSPLLNGLGDDAYAYFVHSYALPPGPETIASADYGTKFSAMIAHRNFHGAQFHPERSSTAGATVLRNFLEL
jgi:imidazole glycerol-phosphate synthase subunit HisH